MLDRQTDLQSKAVSEWWCGSDPFTAVGFGGGTPKDNSTTGDNQLTTIEEGHFETREARLLISTLLYVLRI